MKKFKNLFIAIVTALCALVSNLAFAAAPTLDSIAAGVSLSTSAVITLFGIIIAGLAVLWGIRKMIKTTNKS